MKGYLVSYRFDAMPAIADTAKGNFCLVVSFARPLPVRKEHSSFCLYRKTVHFLKRSDLAPVSINKARLIFPSEFCA